MLPFLHPREDLQLGPVTADAVRPGDILAYRPRSQEIFARGPGFGCLVTHRVVRRLRVGGQRVFVTKGDNRLKFDPVVFPDQIVGRVARAGGRDLTRGWRRAAGVWVAWVSYLQAMLYHRMLCMHFGRLNKLRLALERRGWISPVFLKRSYEWAVRFVSRGRIRSSATRGIRPEPWVPDDLRAMTEIWNASFPDHATTERRLRQFILAASDGWPSECRVLRRGGAVLGWGVSRGKRLECLAASPEGWASGAAGLLFHPAVTEFGPMPVPSVGEGIVLGREAALAADFGFRPLSVLTEMVLTRERFGEFQKQLPLRGVRIRPWQEGDRERIQEEMQAPELNRRLVERHFSLGGKPERVLLAVRKQRLTGLILGLPDEEAHSCAHLGGWVWSAARPGRPRGYLFHAVVDLRARGWGIGPLLVLAGTEQLFQSGCAEARLWAQDERLWRKLGFLSGQRFVRMSREGMP